MAGCLYIPCRMLDRVDAVIYPHRDLPAPTRKRLMTGVGFSAEKIHTSYREQDLVSGSQAVELFNALLDGNPDTFIMVAFPGHAFLGEWENLVGDIFESVILRLPRERQEQGRQTLESIRAILERIREIRTVLKTNPGITDHSLMEAVIRDIDPPPSKAIMDEVRKHALLAMFSHGGDYLRQGQIASYLNLVDNVFPTDDLLESPQRVREQLVRSIMERP